MVPRNQLAVLALGGFVSCLLMAEIFKRQVSYKIEESPLFKEALESLRRNAGAQYLLGVPINHSFAKFAGPGIPFADHSIVKVPVIGPKSGGILYYTAKPDKDEKMLLDTVQLQVGRDDSRRLVIKKSTDVISSVA